MVFIPWTRHSARNPKAVGRATPGISAQEALGNPQASMVVV